MTWGELMPLEVAAEFRRLMGFPYEHVENALFNAYKYQESAWAEHGQWWRRTTRGKAYLREYGVERVKRMKATTVAVRGCASCGKPFAVSAYRVERGRDRVCSPECRGSARKNIQRITIGGQSMPLVRWAEKNGLALRTVWARVSRGWAVERAISTPAANRGQKTRAA